MDVTIDPSLATANAIIGNNNSKMPLITSFDPLDTYWPKEMDEFSNLAFQACHQEVKRVSESLSISQGKNELNKR